MRKNLNAWRFNFEDEDAGPALERFLIAFDELRARLAPSKYPNIEVSDEGHLWFNVDSLVGVVEVLAFPFGFGGIEAPFFAVSLPRKAEDVDLGLLNRLMKIAGDNEAQLFANQKTTTVDEILSAYSRNEHPPLGFTSDFDEILSMKVSGVFFSYLGVRFSVAHETVSEIEVKIRNIISRLEQK